MSFDLSIALNYITGAFLAVNTAGPVPDWQQGQWSNADAVTLSAELPNQQIDAFNKNYQRDALRDFLALYSVTRDNGEESNGWDDLPISNGNETQQALIRRALFGDGTQQGSLIKNVYIGSTQTGESDYLGMRTVLSQLRVENRAVDNHHNHFHINLDPPPRLGIGGSLLLAAARSVTNDNTAPAAPGTSSQGYDAVMSVCQVVANQGSPLVSEANGVSPSPALLHYFMSRGQYFTRDQWQSVSEQWQLIVTDTPKHGDLVPYENGFIYQPREGYLGPDQMTFEVEMNGKMFKVIYSVDVTAGHPAASRPSDPCPSSFQIKELPNSGTNDNGSALDILELPSDGPVSPEQLAELHASLSFSFGFGLLGLTGLSSLFGFGGTRVSLREKGTDLFIGADLNQKINLSPLAQ